MKTIHDWKKMKESNEKITMVTAYDYPSAKLAEQAGIDTILVGDSLGMVVLGYDSTIEVTVDDMIHHAKAVRRGAPNTFVIVDMPFMSYHLSIEQSMVHAQKIMQKTRAEALKIEGVTDDSLLLIEKLAAAGVPVVGHIGLTPQLVHVLGGFKVQGRDKDTALKLIKDAKALEESGAIAIVLECVPDSLAEYITESVSIPTIGIGAGEKVDGQVLVYHDLLKYGSDLAPSFVKTYAEVEAVAVQGLRQYHQEVKQGQFPTSDYSFQMKEEIMEEIKQEEQK